MGPVSNALSSSARYITPLEFARSLSRVLGIDKAGSNGQNQSSTVGLAISGGVDSMALAVLCSNLRNMIHVQHESISEEFQHLKTLSFKSFIVDHQVRSGSFEEARSVSNVLEKRGIETEILKIEWPISQSTTAASNFESIARKYRFRLLGQACKDRSIKSLLLAHHEDDQVETIMMRLTGGHRRIGLLGIHEVGGIPECYGMHGIYESGDLEALRPKALTSPFPSKPETPIRQLEIEKGGISICRPMLEFSKARLIATCQHEDMEWFEDHTNKDPSLTIRNAIRHMYNDNVMPAALSKSSLLGLRQSVKASRDQEDAIVELLLATCSIKEFNTRTGTITVVFPTTSDILKASEVSKIDVRIIASMLLRHIIFLVSPLDRIRLPSLQGTLLRIFPGLLNPEEHPSVNEQHMVAGVFFQPLDTQEPVVESSKAAQHQWLLSRQRHNTSTIKHKTIELSSTKDKTWTDWTLWDGRYWIRVQNLNSDTSLIVRPFQEADMKQFRDFLNNTVKKELDNVLKTEASGKIRWTLPAIVSLDKSTKKEQVLALPTLGFQGRNVEFMIRWEVRYKKIYAEGFPMPQGILEKKGQISESHGPDLHATSTLKKCG